MDRIDPPQPTTSTQISPPRALATGITTKITPTQPPTPAPQTNISLTPNVRSQQTTLCGPNASENTVLGPVAQTKPQDVTKKSLTTDALEAFFAKGLQNSCQATDELIRNIEASQSEMLARDALNLYQNYYNTLERPWDHETFLYGLGLIYMHFNAYNWAVKSFRDTVYTRPGFPRSKDIHTRLGLIFKSAGRYDLSEKHFKLAINDTRRDSGISTKLELMFHIAHLTELKGDTKQAIELYEKLLQDKDLPQKLSANIHRQLGWIYYTDVARSSNLSNSNESSRKQQLDNLSSARKLDAALNHLNISYGFDSDSQTSYYLGRCSTNIGKFQDAFAFYRKVIDKEESTADTWCSIGVLYQRQNQPLLAVQAYIRSVQHDKKHAVAWMNLGSLYESHNQFVDALKCYQHVLRSNSGQLDYESLQCRVNYIQDNINDFERTSSNSIKSETNSDRLLSLEDLWNMESKTNQDSYSNNTGNTDNSELASPKNPPSEIKLNNNNDQQAITEGFDDNRRLAKLIEEAPKNQDLSDNHMTTHLSIKQDRKCNGQVIGKANLCESTDLKNFAPVQDMILPLEENGKIVKQSQMSSIHHITTTTNLNGLKRMNDCETGNSTTINQSCLNSEAPPLDSKDFCLNQLFNNGASKDSGISSDGSTYTDSALISSQNTDCSSTSFLTSEQVLEACKNASNLKKIDINLLSDEIKPPSSFIRHPVYPGLASNLPLPVPPSIFLDSKKDLTSKRLQEICQSHPISIVRNIASVLKLDLGLFSTKTLAETNPDQRIDIVSHLCNLSADGPTISNGSKSLSWTCERHLSSSTISRYANYQVTSFRQSLLDEHDNKLKQGSNTKESETDSNESAAYKKLGEISSRQHDAPSAMPKCGSATKKFKKSETKVKFVKSAQMIDLSDDKKWRSQLVELNKLPHYMKCVSASNMLTHIGHAVPGLNTIGMSMHVPGCKMVGYKTPNNFCTVNINTGPGDYEWFAIPGQYENTLRKLCNRNGCDMDKKNWWPPTQQHGMQEHGVPVYRFTQRPGDLVWINSSTLYWVQASGWANSIQWNLGPLSARQYQLASESYELNKFLHKRSEVPLVQLTWNMVINIGFIPDDELSSSLINVMKRSLRYCKSILNLIHETELAIETPNDEPGPRVAKYCSLCENEIFNITFEKGQDLSTHCIECVRRATDTFEGYSIKQQYDIRYLSKLYDTFISTRRRYQEIRIKQKQ